MLECLLFDELLNDRWLKDKRKIYMEIVLENLIYNWHDQFLLFFIL